MLVRSEVGRNGYHLWCILVLGGLSKKNSFHFRKSNPLYLRERFERVAVTSWLLDIEWDGELTSALGFSTVSIMRVRVYSTLAKKPGVTDADPSVISNKNIQ